MTDARFPERWLNDRRVLRLPDDAFRLFVLSLAWSVANRTDGRLYDDDLPLIPGGHPVEVGRDLMPVTGPERHLVKAELWERVADYWLIRDFEDTQTTRHQLEHLDRKRRLARDRQRRKRERDAQRDVTRDDSRTGQARTGALRGSDEADPW